MFGDFPGFAFAFTHTPEPLGSTAHKHSRPPHSEAEEFRYPQAGSKKSEITSLLPRLKPAYESGQGKAP